VVSPAAAVAGAGRWLAPSGWPAFPDEDRTRVRLLAWLAIWAQVLFVLGWIVGGLLERGYSPVRQYTSELGRHGAAHPWIFNLVVVLWGLGFIALAIAMFPALRARPWARVAPSLFLLAGVFAIAIGPLRLDCAAAVDRICSARQHAGLLSWREYGHVWVSFGLELTLLLTPFALARSLWPGRLARLILTAAGAVATLLLLFLLVGVSVGAHTHHGGPDGLWQRLWLLVVNGWVLLCAGALILDAGRHDVAQAPAPVA
jgi:hypothetical protein